MRPHQSATSRTHACRGHSEPDQTRRRRTHLAPSPAAAGVFDAVHHRTSRTRHAGCLQRGGGGALDGSQWGGGGAEQSVNRKHQTRRRAQRRRRLRRRRRRRLQTRAHDSRQQMSPRFIQTRDERASSAGVPSPVAWRRDRARGQCPVHGAPAFGCRWPRARVADAPGHTASRNHHPAITRPGHVTARTPRVWARRPRPRTWQPAGARVRARAELDTARSGSAAATSAGRLVGRPSLVPG